MAKPEWGTKRICPNCGTRYYDLRKDPPACPNCGTVFDPEALLKSRRARPIPVEEAPKKAPVEREDDEETLDVETEETVDEEEVDVEAEEEVEVADVEEEEDEAADEDADVLLEDADELGDDDIEVTGDVDSDDDR